MIETRVTITQENGICVVDYVGNINAVLGSLDWARMVILRDMNKIQTSQDPISMPVKPPCEVVPLTPKD